MVDRRSKNVEIFEDTMEFCTDNLVAKDRIFAGKHWQKLYLETDEIGMRIEDRTYRKTEVVVSRKRSFEAAGPYAKQNKRVCVLNFASATHPGGGVVGGSSAQEEALCRCSTLYPCLIVEDLWNRFYLPHRGAHNPLNNDDIIYTPSVLVFKNDASFPERMKEEDWYGVDVLTCAAPNLGAYLHKVMKPISNDEIYKLLVKRIDRIFEVAAINEVEVLILGAFGCGAFCNPPELVAKAFAEAQKRYEGVFETIEYAIYCRDYEAENYVAFTREMEDYHVW